MKVGTRIATVAAVRLCVLVICCAFATDVFAKGARNHFGPDSSPYLRLHADDPVHWRPWGEAALAEAREQEKPVLLSIGYSACHWCHVMRRESYMDPATADAINAAFIPVLIDREERPDIDAQYQTAAALMGLPNGWPLTLFLTPDGVPFWGGAYYPKEPRAGMPAFRSVLGRVATAYRDHGEAITRDADKVSDILSRVFRPRPGQVTLEMATKVAQAVLGRVDVMDGGFEGTSKFTEADALSLLWRAYLRTGREAFKDAVLLTLRQMGDGGVYDHVGGGYFRYAIDPGWQVPHFEKMLDVNATMLRLLAEVWRETRDRSLARKAHETAAFMLDEMRLESGAFATALDADSIGADGEEAEGAFYIWEAEALKSLLGPHAAPFAEAFALAEVEHGAGALSRVEKGGHAVDTALEILHRHRAKRPRPRRDDKVLADWNGMAIRGMAEAALAFDRPKWLAAAEAAFAAADQALTDDAGRLRQSAFAGTRGAPRPPASPPILTAPGTGWASSSPTTGTRCRAASSPPPPTPARCWCATGRFPTIPMRPAARSPSRPCHGFPTRRERSNGAGMRKRPSRPPVVPPPIPAGRWPACSMPRKPT